MLRTRFNLPQQPCALTALNPAISSLPAAPQCRRPRQVRRTAMQLRRPIMLRLYFAQRTKQRCAPLSCVATLGADWDGAASPDASGKASNRLTLSTASAAWAVIIGRDLSCAAYARHALMLNFASLHAPQSQQSQRFDLRGASGHPFIAPDRRHLPAT